MMVTRVEIIMAKLIEIVVLVVVDMELYVVVVVPHISPYPFDIDLK